MEAGHIFGWFLSSIGLVFFLFGRRPVRAFWELFSLFGGWFNFIEMSRRSIFILIAVLVPTDFFWNRLFFELYWFYLVFVMVMLDKLSSVIVIIFLIIFGMRGGGRDWWFDFLLLRFFFWEFTLLFIALFLVRGDFRSRRGQFGRAGASFIWRNRVVFEIGHICDCFGMMADHLLEIAGFLKNRINFKRLSLFKSVYAPWKI